MQKFVQKILFGFKFEQNPQFYHSWGVRLFKRWVPFGDFWIGLYNKVFSKRLQMIETKDDAIVWVLLTWTVEILHFLVFIVIFWLTVQALFQSHYVKGFMFSILNIIINVYPMLVQRYNRIRILRIFRISPGDIKHFKL